MSAIFNTILYQPIFNLLILIYNMVPGKDFGVAIIILTILIRLIFSPLSVKTLISQRKLTALQPKIKEINQKHKDDKQTAAKATMDLYKEHKVNPFSGCLPLLIQIPILLALYKAFSSGLNPSGVTGLYSFVSNPGAINSVSLGFINLASSNPFLAVTAGVLQWVQAKLAAINTRTKPDPNNKGSAPDLTTAMMSKQMLYFLPIMIIIISWRLPTGLVIYWVVTTIYSIFEQLYINRRHPVT